MRSIRSLAANQRELLLLCREGLLLVGFDASQKFDGLPVLLFDHAFPRCRLRVTDDTASGIPAFAQLETASGIATPWAR